MASESKNEVIVCKFFITTLVGSTLIWFWQHLEKSIASFEIFILYS